MKHLWFQQKQRRLSVKNSLTYIILCTYTRVYHMCICPCMCVHVCVYCACVCMCVCVCAKLSAKGSLTYIHIIYINIPYGRKFWRGIYFGGLAVLRAIRQYFIRQRAAHCDVIIIAKSYQCVYTRPAARRACLIVGIEFTIKSCVRGHHFSKDFCTPEVGEELACLSRRRRRS